MENKKESSFSTLKKWVKKNQEEDLRNESEMKKIVETPIRVSLTEKILAYSIVIIVLGFIGVLYLV